MKSTSTERATRLSTVSRTVSFGGKTIIVQGTACPFNPSTHRTFRAWCPTNFFGATGNGETHFGTLMHFDSYHGLMGTQRGGAYEKLPALSKERQASYANMAAVTAAKAIELIRSAFPEIAGELAGSGGLTAEYEIRTEVRLEGDES